MTTADNMPTHRKPRRLGRLLSAFLSVVLGTLLSLTALSAVLLLGWLMTLMRKRAMTVLGQTVADADQPTWMLGPKTSRGLSRWFGGLARNARAGIQGSAALFVATFPFASFWLVAWWAGWENSFNKGYEQAFVGPMAGMIGIAVFAVIMVYLPIALAHQAVERRAFALLELRQVTRIVSRTGWGYVMWAAVTLLFALPIFASRGLPAFGEGIYPPLANMTPEQVAQIRGMIDLMTALYIFVSSVILKRWSAGIYARALLRLGQPRSGLFRRFGKGIRFACLFSIWVGLAVLIFVGQFLNHDWHIWLTHPYVFLPWVG